MKIFGFEIVRSDHYEHLVHECTTLAISNVRLEKENARLNLDMESMFSNAMGRIRLLEAKDAFTGCLLDELTARIKRKNAPRDSNGRFIKKDESKK